MKIAFISATSGFTLGMAAHLIRRPELADGTTLVLFAPPEEADDLQLMSKAVTMMARGEKRALAVEATTDRQAALEGDRQAIVQALLLGPSLRRLEHAGEIADRMLAAHGQYLPMFAA